MTRRSLEIVLFARNDYDAYTMLEMRSAANRRPKVYIEPMDSRRKIMDRNRGLDKEIEQ
jgi:hypothetical protein